MCSLIILRRPDHPWPLLLGGNRDELRDRPWGSPGRHWDDRPDVVAGIDLLAGGSWMGINDDAVVAVIMNRVGTLGPAPDKRSRGELVLEALDHSDAKAAAGALADLAPQAYRPFNLFLGDPVDAYWIRNTGDRVRVAPVPSGLHMLTARELDDTADPRIRAFLTRFRNAETPAPERGDWAAWQKLLGSTKHADREPANASMCFELQNGFATVSSSLIAVPRWPGFGGAPEWLFAAGPPDRTEFRPVAL
jgi:uncharacterized protein with NRDE domain